MDWNALPSLANYAVKCVSKWPSVPSCNIKKRLPRRRRRVSLKLTKRKPNTRVTKRWCGEDCTAANNNNKGCFLRMTTTTINRSNRCVRSNPPNRCDLPNRPNRTPPRPLHRRRRRHDANNSGVGNCWARRKRDEDRTHTHLCTHTQPLIECRDIEKHDYYQLHLACAKLAFNVCEPRLNEWCSVIRMCRYFWTLCIQRKQTK